ncbi:hypothetical protein BS50DRAFT_520523 [Corynespora cassiicola Philippines]|uniref:Uncharacterized protein n=1 Tax=Corynespora cassiicola Philippines TaxID=1448308 RepID=A0A2T2NT12_CORCC|nr:hypothetical protein BS50DRAFT_520523 [Corynespora cassiicola Philippines]
MAAALSVIGIVADVISMVPLFSDIMAPKTDRQTTVRIGVGLSKKIEANTGGNTPGIRIFDVMGRDIGEARGSKDIIADGGFKDIVVESNKDTQGRQAQYISVSKGGDNALCVAYVSMTWPDGQNKAWYGDVGMECGGKWYESQNVFGDSNYSPKCLWIDGDESNGITTEGFGLHITDFTATEERMKAYKDDKDTMCKSKPRFHLYDDLKSDYFLPFFNPPLEYDDNLVDKNRDALFVDGDSTGPLPPKNRKRSATHHRSTLAKRHHFPGKLVSSDKKAHSARALCESGNSLGPDFVSKAEGLFCDMSEKELWPLCDENHLSGCFNTTSHTMIAASLSRRDEATGRHIPEKDYNDVSDW